MDGKTKFFYGIIGCMVSMGIGAGGVYLMNQKKIEFAERYSLMLEMEEFMVETAEVGIPESPSEETIVNAYLSLYEDEYTYWRNSVDIYSEEYNIKEMNKSAVAVSMGFEIAFDEEQRPVFTKVIEGMPAHRQGICEGDTVVEVSGTKMAEYRDCKYLRGADGSNMTLKLLRGGSELTLDVVRSADDNLYDGVSAEKSGNTLIIKYTEMQLVTPGTIEAILDENTFDSIVFDLRGNHGGYTSIPIAIADLFIGKADVVLHPKNRDIIVQSTTDSVKYNVPMAVVINGDTASSAEILAALLSQYADAEIVGTTSFGKGIYQSYAMFNGGHLQYTDGYVTVGDWDCYQGVGITPDYEVNMDKELIGTPDDIQLQKALELLR